MAAIGQRKIRCMTAETGTLVLAVLKLMLSTMSSVYVTCSFVFFCVMMYRNVDRPHIDSLAQFEASYFAQLSWNTGVGMMVSSYISLVFAAFLLAGVMKKRAAYVKAYFVYGVIMNIFTIIAGAVFGFFGNYSLAIVIFVVCIVHYLILMMVYRTYKKYETTHEQFSHKPLEDTEKCYNIEKF